MCNACVSSTKVEARTWGLSASDVGSFPFLIKVKLAEKSGPDGWTSMIFFFLFSSQVCVHL